MTCALIGCDAAGLEGGAGWKEAAQRVKEHFPAVPRARAAGLCGAPRRDGADTLAGWMPRSTPPRAPTRYSIVGPPGRRPPRDAALHVDSFPCICAPLCSAAPLAAPQTDTATAVTQPGPSRHRPAQQSPIFRRTHTPRSYIGRSATRNATGCGSRYLAN